MGNIRTRQMKRRVNVSRETHDEQRVQDQLYDMQCALVDSIFDACHGTSARDDEYLIDEEWDDWGIDDAPVRRLAGRSQAIH